MVNMLAVPALALAGNWPMAAALMIDGLRTDWQHRRSLYKQVRLTMSIASLTCLFLRRECQSHQPVTR